MARQTLNLIEAIQAALKEALNADDRVMALGQDIGKNGGVFRATDGLQAQFDARRVLDMPLAESLIAGMAVGLATQGLRPVAEFQFMGFFHAGFEHIANHAARMRNRTRGRLTCPLVYRMPYGGGIHAPEHHSESLESVLAHLPGLRVLAVHSPQQAYTRLLDAIASDDPVVYLEPKRLYRASREAVDCHPLHEAQPSRITRAQTLRTGDDVTLIAWGAQIPLAMAAATALATQGIQATVLDLVSLKPIDLEAVLSVTRITGRVIIIHEATRTAGLGAEISALICEHAIYDLLGPVLRITGEDTIMPYAQLEQAYLPSVHDVVNAARSLVGGSVHA